MSRPIIEVRGLSKRYLLGAIGATSLRVEFQRYLSRLRGAPAANPNEFWALRDISFDVNAGEVIGIIGRNGAGKSTLLKILSRITEPTSGKATLRGRVASLLEVGTGFHPELSGRENVFLNGAILGMTKREVRRKFDEIVAFAEVERFIDTPVKHYSSGMYVRLAFAVAAHLEPEILIVDEVLAVGDAAFQAKCIGKIQDVSHQHGRTVFFVSHNLAAVSQLTQRCLLLQSGRLVYAGPTERTLEEYFVSDQSMPSTSFDVADRVREHSTGQTARILRLRFERKAPQFGADEALSFVITVRANADLPQLRASVTVFSNEGAPVGSGFSPDTARLRSGETVDLRIRLPQPRLAPGHYHCDVAIGTGTPQTGLKEYDVVTKTIQFEVLAARGASGTLSQWQHNWGKTIYSGVTIEPVPPGAG